MAIDQGSLRYGHDTTVTTVETRNRVLRNTYWLLALSMVPTVLGAWIGVSTGFSFFAGSPFIGLIAFLAIAFGFMYGINRYKDSSIGIVLLRPTSSAAPAAARPASPPAAS